MGDKFRKFVEWGMDCKYVPRGTRCGICEKQFGFFASGFWSVNARQLDSDSICKKCYDRILGLLDKKNEWMPRELQKSIPWKQYSRRTLYKMTLQDARELIALKEKADQNLLAGYGDNVRSMLRVQEAFQIEPTPLQVGVARAKQLKNRMVVFGCVEQGVFQKGDAVRIDSQGKITETTIIEAYIQQEDFPFEKEMSARMGKQQIPKGKAGWLILDMEWGVFEGDLVIG